MGKSELPLPRRPRLHEEPQVAWRGSPDPETAPPERRHGLCSPATRRGCRRALPASWTGTHTPMSICPGCGQAKLCCWPNRMGWASVSATADSRAQQVGVEALLGARHQGHRSKHGRRGTASPEPPARWVTGVGREGAADVVPSSVPGMRKSDPQCHATDWEWGEEGGGLFARQILNPPYCKIKHRCKTYPEQRHRLMSITITTQVKKEILRLPPETPSCARTNLSTPLRACPLPRTPVLTVTVLPTWLSLWFVSQGCTTRDVAV